MGATVCLLSAKVDLRPLDHLKLVATVMSGGKQTFAAGAKGHPTYWGMRIFGRKLRPAARWLPLVFGSGYAKLGHGHRGYDI